MMNKWAVQICRPLTVAAIAIMTIASPHPFIYFQF